MRQTQDTVERAKRLLEPYSGLATRRAIETPDGKQQQIQNLVTGNVKLPRYVERDHRNGILSFRVGGARIPLPNDPTTQAIVRVTAHDTQNQAVDVSNAVFIISNTTGVTPTPLAFAVHHPMPSPFTGTTSIGFDLPALPAGMPGWKTTGRVYNLAGRLVRTALTAALQPGPHTVVWDGKDERGASQPSGVYFVEIATTRHQGQVRAVYLR